MAVHHIQPQVGDLIDDFTLLDDQGRPWSLSGSPSRTTLLIFHRHLM